MTDVVKPGVYTITVYADNLLNPRPVDYSFVITLTDPCSSTPTELTVDSLGDRTIVIDGTTTTVWTTNTDSVSITHGNGNGREFCGLRLYELTNPVS